jgi:DNA-binding response OmpR family regulator
MGLEKSILIFIDEENLRRSLALILDRAGYEVTTVTKTKEAFKFLEAYPFDLALVDLKVPQKDSQNIIPTIHKLAPEMPVLILTPSSSTGCSDDRSWSGYQEYLVKPVDPPRLLAQVDALLTMHRDLRRAESQ